MIKHKIKRKKDGTLKVPKKSTILMIDDINEENEYIINCYISSLINDEEFINFTICVYYDRINILKSIYKYGGMYTKFFDNLYVYKNILYEFDDQKEKETFIRKRKIKSIL